MARIPIRIYKNSFLASTVSIFGSILFISGIFMVFEEVVPGIICGLIGLGLFIWAPRIAEKKKFKTWVKKLRETGVIDMLATSHATCVEVYNAYPTTWTLDLIRQHNPETAQAIADSISKK